MEPSATSHLLSSSAKLAPENETSESDAQVAVVDTHGRVVWVASTALRYSPAVYGVLVEENRALLCIHPASGFYTFPGGRVDKGQTVEQALRQHFRAATGITPFVQELLLLEEQLILDAEERPWRLNVMYYRLSRPPVGHMGLIDFENPAKPDWLALNHLERQQMQFGYDALQLAHKT